MNNQLLRSGTSIDALVRKAEHTECKPDFIHEMALTRKEANETAYWLELLHQAGYINAESSKSIAKDITELNNILASILITSKRRKNEDN